jgi:amino acid adenylation domain-containing protein/non-ribosomal peptide synthase protein (TIGR01720 family)
MAQQNWSEMQQRIAALSPEKRSLFEQQLRQRNLRLNSAILKRPNPADRPLSFAQQRLWFLHQIDPHNPAYNIAMLWHFQGDLNPSILSQCLNVIVQRHEVLRTAFVSQDGQPLQILQDHPLQLEIVDLQSHPEATAQIQTLARQEASTPFDLNQAPLLRATLLQINPHQSVLLLTLHHIVADGWSRGIFMREFIQLYKAFLSGQSSPLPDLSIQYPDFAFWQQQTLHPEFQQQLTYWKQQLANLPPLNLEIGDRPRIAQPSFKSAIATHSLSPTLLTALKSLSRQTGTTLFMTLLAAFKLLLHRYSGQNDFAVGIPIANRNAREIESLIGFFVNTLVIRTNLSGNPDFLTLLSRVREVTAAAYQHQDLPFAQLVEALQPQRSLNDNPLFQIMFQLQNETYQLQNALTPDLAIPNLSLRQDWIDSGYTKFDLTWHLVERDQELLAVAEYRTDRFDAATIARMLGHFQILLEAIAANPHQRLSELPLLTPAEQQQIQCWNSPITSFPITPIHRQFEAQVERTPDRIAVRYQDQTLTYQQLNEQANQLAHYLGTRGIVPETIVGIHLERSLPLMVGLLGILKAGAAYLPLDTSTPDDRLHFMLQDAQVKLLITDKPHASIPSLSLTDTQICHAPTYNPQVKITPENLAYIIYTSGSTGQPKGSLLSHQNLSHYLHWCIQSHVSPDGIGAPVQSSISFDATITSLYTPLLVGQTVELLPNGIEALAQALMNPYSFVKLTPAHLRLLSQWLTINPTPITPQTFILGGEALAESDLTFWRQNSPQHRFINEYGPTEATVGCCVYEAIAPYPQASIPIGRSILNTHAHILDAYLQPVPVGIPGELYISGNGLSRGYGNRADITADRFIPNLDKNSTRLYRTGDRARYRPDGNIDYLGRLDHQVKIRGYRIELEEIALTLQQHPHIQEAIAIATSDPNGNTRLIAYYTSPFPLSAADLRTFLQSKLPDYMIPSLFQPLPSIPLTANGKVDRQALPTPHWAETPTQNDRPLTDIETTLAQIWTDVLGVSVGVNDNFFELGGDSILSLQTIARANQAGFKLSPRQIFQYQTIAELAPFATPSIAIDQGIVTGTLPLTPIQHWFFEQQSSHPFNQSLLLEVTPDLNPQFLEAAWHHLLYHHDALRLRFVQANDTWQSFHADPLSAIAAAPLNVINLSHLSPFEQSQTITTTANALQASLDLAKSLGQIALFRLGNTRDRLLIIFHHLVIDGISWQILLEDLVTAYQQSNLAQPLKLPAKTTAFCDWSQHLTQYAQSAQLQAELSYWSEVCESQPLSILSTSESDRSSITVSLNLEQTTALLKKTTRYTRINEMLTAALALTLKEWTQSDRIRIDLESHGREDLFDIDISRTIGWFTSIFPISLNLSTAPTIQEVLNTTQSSIREIPHHGIGYGVLKYLNRSESLLNLSSSTVKFNYLGSLDRLCHGFILGQAEESSGSLPDTPPYPLEINGWIKDEQLYLQWTAARSPASTIQHWANHCLQHLQTLIHSENRPSVTDFPAARLDQKQLDRLMAKIQQPGRK